MLKASVAVYRSTLIMEVRKTRARRSMGKLLGVLKRIGIICPYYKYSKSCAAFLIFSNILKIKKKG